MAAGSPLALAGLQDAYRHPWTVADAWRGDGGRVVGVLGHDLPREIVAAGGLLPIRLSPLRLDRAGESHGDAVPAGLAAQLAPGPALVLGALLAGRLDWIDALAIGRDSEAHTSLFYVIRELVRSGQVTGLMPFAFCDLLVGANRHSARYNRLRARQFADVVAGWAGRKIGEPELAAAVADGEAVAAPLRELAAQRADRPPRLRGRDALIAAGAAQVLPAGRARELLAALAGDALAVDADAPVLRLFLTGSGIDDPRVYEVLEAKGVAIVGEDHEWGDDGGCVAAPTRDPLDGIVDRYHLGPRGAARSALASRIPLTMRRVQATGAEAVLQVVLAADETPPWELPALRRALGDAVPVTAVTLHGDAGDAEALRCALTRLRPAVGRV